MRRSDRWRPSLLLFQSDRPGFRRAARRPVSLPVVDKTGTLPALPPDPPGPPSKGMTMHFRHRAAGALVLPVLALLAACEKPEPRAPMPDAPRIQSFAPDRAELLPGEATALRYSVTGATSVKVLGMGGEELDLTGDAATGEVQVQPDETAIYVLRAEGPGGRAAAFAQVAVGEALRTAFLVAVPPEVEPGDSVDLAWSAQGARAVTLRDDAGMNTALDGQRGVVTVTPTASRVYTLSATGPDGAVKTMTAEVKVRPRIDLLTLAPGVAQVGEAVQVRWQTSGADTIVVEEATFGELFRTTDPAVAQGDQFEWTVPAQDPNGLPLIDGYRLQFTVRVRSESTGTELTRTFVRHIGHGPSILLFEAPEFATPGRDVLFSWRVTGAERVQLFANGLLVYEPRGSDPDALAVGAAQLKAPIGPTRYDLVVEGFGGATATASKLLDLVGPPTITGFNLSAFVLDPGDAATATWTTQGATEVQIRVKNGPVVYSSKNPVTVGNGSAALFPGTPTTYVLDAINAAGDLASCELNECERTVNVVNRAQVTVTPAHPTPGQTVTVAWDLPAPDLQEVLGVVTAQPDVIPMSGQFIDLKNISASRELLFATSDDDVSTLPQWLAFRFPFAGQLRNTFHVSTNGFLAFDPPQPMPDNAVLPWNPDRSSTGAGTRQWLPALLAPLWDDLELGSGRVLFHVEGNQFPRTLIVQWDGVHLKGDGDSELTFQIQLLESGEFHFVYGTLDGGSAPSADGSATVGVHAAEVGFESAFSVNETGKIFEGAQLHWFKRVTPQGSFTLPAERSTRHTFFYRRNDGSVITLTAPVIVWGENALLVSEAMAAPTAQKGHWVELVNTTPESMPLEHVELVVSSTGMRFPFPANMELPAGKRLVIGASDDAMENGGVTTGLVIEGLTLAHTDEVRVEVNNLEISKLAWTDAAPGQSVERLQRVITDAKVDKVCPRTATYGDMAEKGTPGLPAEPCTDYLLEAIAWNPADILGSGKVAMQTFLNNPRWVTAPLEHPVTLFGRAYEEVMIASHGYVSFDFLPWPHQSGGAINNYSYSADRAPKPTRPNASIVPYGAGWWMHTQAAAQRADLAIVWRRIAPGEQGPGSKGEYVFHWNRLTHLSDATSGSATRSDATFQVRLFDDGVIEFHIGRMQDGSAASVQGLSDGLLGPSWIESPSGTEALTVNLASRDPGLRSFTGFRFTPSAALAPAPAPAP